MLLQWWLLILVVAAVLLLVVAGGAVFLVILVCALLMLLSVQLLHIYVYLLDLDSIIGEVITVVVGALSLRLLCVVDLVDEVPVNIVARAAVHSI